MSETFHFDWKMAAKKHEHTINQDGNRYKLEIPILDHQNYYLKIFIHHLSGGKEPIDIKLKATSGKKYEVAEFHIDFSNNSKQTVFMKIQPKDTLKITVQSLKVCKNNADSTEISENTEDISKETPNSQTTTPSKPLNQGKDFNKINYNNNLISTNKEQKTTPKQTNTDSSSNTIKEEKRQTPDNKQEKSNKYETIICKSKTQSQVKSQPINRSNSTSNTQNKDKTTVYRPPTQQIQSPSKYDTRKDQPYCGLINQGATCYMNSFIQILYHTKLFKVKMQEIETEDRVICALAKLFDLMDKSKVVPTTDLTKDFGWGNNEVHEEQDAQEFLSVLINKIQDTLDKTKYKDTIKNIFGIGITSEIEYENGDKENKPESELQLNLQLTNNIVESIKAFQSKEVIDEIKHNDQMMKATRTSRFTAFPKILVIQLSRFSYDRTTYMPIKLQEKCTVTEHINIGKPYTLFGIISHLGTSAEFGHYISIIKPKGDASWYTFNDEDVTKTNDPLSSDRVVENAYLLFYSLDE